ncbi:MAG: hypothetical protein JWL77_1818 [Chthonomonadaceae bacterium]|nr:hypothetical protein [Chthonomonadaceae bacterium]
MLCRALVRNHFGRYGTLAARAAQPGVEFHLRLHAECSLGEPNRWYGWQCRWYDLPSGKALGSTRKHKIEEAIHTTERELPDLTDWVLWTRYPLTASDQRWFYGLQTQMRKHLWTAAEVEEYLSGDAAILRGTYFGECVLTPNCLAVLHERAVEPIRWRWQPEVHQPVNAERMLRQILGESGTWDDLPKLSDQLKKDAEAIEADLGSLENSLADATAATAKLARAMAVTLIDMYALLVRGEIDLLRQQITNRSALQVHEFAVLPRKLRACRQHAALTVTNALANVRDAEHLLNKFNKQLGQQFIAVLAKAGCGKTELAAQLTAPVGERPAGILLHGREMYTGQTLDNFAGQVVIQGVPVTSMETLVAALDAAGQRAHRRLPIVIDGLNESEDPRDWKSRLASLKNTLRRYPYVLVVCTLRTAFSTEVLPTETERLEIPDFDHDTSEAIQRYFNYYLINPVDVEFWWELLRHPLTLRLFCEVTNQKREHVVGIEAVPGSLTALFDRYVEQAAERIAELSPRTHRYYEMDVRSALDEIGRVLWEQSARSLDRTALRRHLGDEGRPWNESLVRALEHEGILLCVPGNNLSGIHVTVAHDMLAGHLAADALLRKYNIAGLAEWLQEPATTEAFTKPRLEQHPLGEDIFQALIGLVPRRLHRQQFWPLLNEPLRTIALRGAADLEGAYLDAQTVSELALMATRPPQGINDIFDRLRRTRGSINHPLNAEFLDAVLRPMPIAKRDLRWTEWVRRRHGELLLDIEGVEKRWRSNLERLPSDRLRALWVMWTQTSTVRKLRDHATRALYWFGRGDPTALFELTIYAFEINDPYLSERMLAAVYGVAMAYQHPACNPDFVQKVLPIFGRRLYEMMFAPTAPHSTTHILAREYAKRTIDSALRHHPTLLTEAERLHIVPPYTFGGIRKWRSCKNCYEGPLGFDFRNYTLGRLVQGRSPYDDKHRGYQTVKANILWRIYELGYTREAFESIDQQIAGSDRSGRMADGSKTERYGKKYAWIAYFELAGFRKDRGLLKEHYTDRLPDVDIDPSFPDRAEEGDIYEPDLLGNRNLSIEEWLDDKTIPPLSTYFVAQEINSNPGPWVLLHGLVRQEESATDRKVFAFLTGLFCKASEVVLVIDALKQHGANRPDFDPPSDYYTYAGEIPWCETYPFNEMNELEVVLNTRDVKRKKKKAALCRDGKPISEQEEHDFVNSLYKEMQSSGTSTSPEAVARPSGETRSRDEILEQLLEAQGLSIEMRVVIENVTERKTKVCEVLNTVRESHWETYHTTTTPGRNVALPARQITDHIVLWSSPQTFNLIDNTCNPASTFIRKGEAYHTGYSLAYLRQDLLDRYLRDSEQSLVWIVFGEREYTSKPLEDRRIHARPPKMYERFHEIIVYSPTAIPAS